MACADDPGARELTAAVRRGRDRADVRHRADASYRVTDIRRHGMRTALNVTGGPGTVLAGAGPVQLEIAVPGRHNALNAAAAFALTVQLGRAGRRRRGRRWRPTAAPAAGWSSRARPTASR